MNKIERIKELISQLNEARKAYYQDSKEIMDNKTYDSLYDELEQLENETGVIYNISPTQQVGYEVKSELVKVRHPEKMLSLAKTKDVNELQKFLKDKVGILSWKLDGLTLVLEYNNGKLISAVTRGNGEIGTDVLHIAKTITNLPQTINYKGKLVVRGECIISYSDFNKNNVNEEYKNPRNLASGTLMLLDANIAKDRNLKWVAFNLVSAEGIDFNNNFGEQLLWLQRQGFEVVYHMRVNKDNIINVISWFDDNIKEYDYPSDGLVLVYDDLKYRDSLGNTIHNPLGWMAFKWQDDTVEATLQDIEFNMGRTGVLTPVVVFNPVEIEGTTVSRASIHNLNILESLELGIGDTITIYKANKIIPQVDDNLTKSNTFKIPTECPICHEETKIVTTEGGKFLYCTNDNCPSKKVAQFSHFVSRNAMNIDGLSEKTIEKFINKGFLKDLSDIYKLEQYKNEIIHMEGFGLKSYNKLIESINKSKQCTLSAFLFALGIPQVGLNSAKLLEKHFKTIENVLFATKAEILKIDDFGEVSANSIIEWINQKENKNLIKALLEFITFKEEKKVETNNQVLLNKVFVITGDVHIYKNRKELQTKIESLGAKVTGSVSKNTNYLINNDINSSSSKNKKAKELNIPIINEEMFQEMIK